MFDVPGRYEIIRRFLAMQLDSMKKGDTLCSLANPLLYKDISTETDPYLIATRKAIERGVKVKRIFNLSEIQAKDEEAARRVIKYQEDTFVDGDDNFECRFLNTTDIAQVYEVATELAHVKPKVASIGGLFYALFIHREDQFYFYRTEDAADQRSLFLGALKMEDGGRRPTYAVLFDALWTACAGAPSRLGPPTLPALLSQASVPVAVTKTNGEAATPGTLPTNERPTSATGNGADTRTES
ncbi:hypothetical protein [Caballeronia sp. NK8]|uniref:hypothetical protein n=1 Tax=Caballeronia sp. NK8 TaxID=140098 RepID=UPI00346392FF